MSTKNITTEQDSNPYALLTPTDSKKKVHKKVHKKIMDAWKEAGEKFSNEMKWADEPADEPKKESAEEAQMRKDEEELLQQIEEVQMRKEEKQLLQQIEDAEKETAEKKAAEESAARRAKKEAHNLRMAALQERLSVLQKELGVSTPPPTWSDVAQPPQPPQPPQNTTAISEEFRRGNTKPDDVEDTPLFNGCENCGDRVQVYNGKPNPLCKPCYEEGKSTPNENDIPECGVTGCENKRNVFHGFINQTCKPCWENRRYCMAQNCPNQVAFDQKHHKFFENCSRQCKNRPQSKTHE